MEKEAKKNPWVSVVKWLQQTFLAGIIVVVPIGITVWILIWIFNSIDNILRPLILRIFGINIPGIGFGVTIILIFIIGAIMSNMIGKTVVRWGENMLGKVPVAKHLYLGIKEVFQGFSDYGSTAFLQVVLVEFPAKGMRTIGFITNEETDADNHKVISVFIPTAPNPTTGFVEILREEDIIRTSIPVEDAVKMVVSGGRMAPKDLKDAMLHSPSSNRPAEPPRK
jgi:uncharacterized membrane protein